MEELAKKIRQHVLRMTHNAKSSHVGSCLSIADILAVLYGGVLKEGDKFILSKGHASAALYAVLAECGYFPVKWLDTFCQSGSLLSGHVSHYVPGVDVSTGSLGHGLSIGCGMAMVTKSKVYVLLGDGDLNEGSIWEAAMFARHHRLANLVVIIDYNKIQALGSTEDVLDLVSLRAKWLAFGWNTVEVNGHDFLDFKAELRVRIDIQPHCIIAHTVKGKGVSWMEGKVEWHYKYPNDEELRLALEELRRVK